MYPHISHIVLRHLHLDSCYLKKTKKTISQSSFSGTSSLRLSSTSRYQEFNVFFISSIFSASLVDLFCILVTSLIVVLCVCQRTLNA